MDAAVAANDVEAYVKINFVFHEFIVVSAGGVVVGTVIGLVLSRALSKTADPVLEIILSLVAPIAIYLAAERLGVSGVLATVIAASRDGRPLNQSASRRPSGVVGGSSP